MKRTRSPESAFAQREKGDMTSTVVRDKRPFSRILFFTYHKRDIGSLPLSCSKWAASRSLSLAHSSFPKWKYRVQAT